MGHDSSLTRCARRRDSRHSRWLACFVAFSVCAAAQQSAYRSETEGVLGLAGITVLACIAAQQLSIYLAFFERLTTDRDRKACPDWEECAVPCTRSHRQGLDILPVCGVGEGDRRLSIAHV